ncbi:MAG TPA: hypothetical protein VNQ32_15730 [Steroidobacteraceae bacterium]|nr:hypothetical protein [Steroidobacteraceae bacterium]
MRFTLHSRHRMSGRGIPQRLVNFALRFGRVEGDRHVLDRREARRVVESLQEDLRLAMHVLDKGGVTVVEDDGHVITTWNRDQRVHRPHGRRELPLLEIRQ